MIKPGDIVLITGAGSGIGRELAILFARHGAIVFVNDVIAQKVMDTVAAIKEIGAVAHELIFDVSNSELCNHGFNQILSLHGKIDYLVTNAGKVAIGELQNEELDSWNEIMNTNFFGQLHLVRIVYPLMQKQKSGHIILVSSIAGLVYQPLTGSYCASKHALVGLGFSLYVEAMQSGVNTHLVCPGYIDDTHIFADAKVNAYDADKIKMLLERKLGGFVSAKRAAEIILNKVKRNKFLIIFPFNAKLLWLMYRLFPTLTIRNLRFLIKLVNPAKVN